MKKNVTMRAAGFLLVGVMLTASIVSGTFAKYVTQDSAQDTARVAKFGVVAAVSGDLFGKSYSAADGNSIQAWSVNAATVSSSGNNEAAADKVVAPGTKNDTGMTISVTGTPEVSTSIKVENLSTVADSDIFLKSGEYGVMTQYTGVVNNDNKTDFYKLDSGTYTKIGANDTLNAGDTYYRLSSETGNVAADYYPVVWTVTGTGSIADSTTYTSVGALKAAVNKTVSVAPNKDLASNNGYGTAKITWAWAFESGADDAAKAATDKKDTILGDMIAAAVNASNLNGKVVVKSDNTYVEVKYAQIDVDGSSASGTNQAYVAYTGNNAPTTASGANVACLTVAFGAQVSVTQVD